jgi:methionyl-tRNA formyltransferase
VLEGNVIKFWNSSIPKKSAYIETRSPGEVLGFSENGVYIQCGHGVVEVFEMQKPGGKKMNAKTCIQSISLDEKSLHFQAKE